MKLDARPLRRASTSEFCPRSKNALAGHRPGHEYVGPARLPQAGVDLLQRRGARAKVRLGERIERRLDGVQIAVQVFRFGINIKEARDDLAYGGVPLQEIHGAEPVVRVIV